MRRGLLRLLHLREKTEAVEEEMIDERARFRALEKREAVRAVSSFNLFQTPVDIADRMASLLGDLDRSMSVLEPSAGLGRLFQAVRRRLPLISVTLVENAPQCCGELYRQTEGDSYAKLHQCDFLSCDFGRSFDRIVMNPPFKMGTDVKHIKHAYSMLKPGGLLVGLCFNGVKQNEHLKPIVDTWEILPEGSFKSEGTKASVVLLTWRA